MNWYVLMTAPQREIATAWALGEHGGVYCPTRWLYRARRGAMRKEEPIRRAYPLLSGYVFTQADSDTELFARLAKMQSRNGMSVGELRDALVRYGEEIDDDRLERASRPHWNGTHVRSVLSCSGAPIIIPQRAIEAIVRLENDLRFVPGPPIVLVLSIGDRVVTLGPNGRREGYVAERPRKGEVRIDFGGEREKVSVNTIRLAA